MSRYVRTETARPSSYCRLDACEARIYHKKTELPDATWPCLKG